MNTEALLRLAECSEAWAEAYVRLTEALLKQGVPEDLARDEARNAATFAALYRENEEEGDVGEVCPLCGRRKN